MKIPDLTENEIQEAVVDHLETYGKPGLVWWHTPNGGKRSVQWASALKRRGVKSGVFDLVLFYRKTFFALELKKRTGRPTEAQLEWRDRVETQGGFTAIANSIDAAVKTLRAWELLL